MTTNLRPARLQATASCGELKNRSTAVLLSLKVPPLPPVKPPPRPPFMAAGWSEPSDTTNAKRELMKLARRVEEVLRVNRISAPYWERSVFHEAKEPLKIEIYRLSVEQETMIGAVLLWHGYRRVQLST